eukprot:4098856-Amphidinium_carterae.1
MAQQTLSGFIVDRSPARLGLAWPEKKRSRGKPFRQQLYAAMCAPALHAFATNTWPRWDVRPSYCKHIWRSAPNIPELAEKVRYMQDVHEIPDSR